MSDGGRKRKACLSRINRTVKLYLGVHHQVPFELFEVQSMIMCWDLRPGVRGNFALEGPI